MTLIADSGSTKTAWCLIETNTIIYTQGINPFQQSEADICAIIQRELLPSLIPQPSAQNPQLSSIYFYGAGCTPEKAPIVATCLKNTLSVTADIHVESDMLGAARGACGHHAGIVCILGTGSNSCYYDGQQLHPGIPALGYILGDEGSGAYIGKRLVGDIFKQQLPDDIRQLFLRETQETQASIIQKVYQEPLPNRYLASVSLFCARHREHPAIHALLLDCFEQFFLRNITPLTSHLSPQTSNLKPHPTVHFVGSIAHYYRSELAEAAERCGYTIGYILQSPLNGLIQYHQPVYL